MIKLFLKDIGIYGISGLMVKALNIFLLPLYIRVLSPEDYGIIDLVTVMSSIVSVVLSMEIYQSIARYFSDVNEKERNLFISTGFWFYFITYSFFLIVFILNAKHISFLLFNTFNMEGIFIIAIISIFINALFSYFQVILRYSLQSIKFSITNIIFTLSTLICTVLFVLVYNWGLKGIFYGQIMGGIIGLIPAVFFNKRYLSLTLDPSSLLKMLKFSLPLVPSSIAIFVLTYTDRLFIQRFLSLHDLGVYGVAFRISSILAIFLGIINTSFAPIIYNNYKNETARLEIKNIYKLTFFGLFAIITFVGIFSREFIFILTTPEYHEAYKIIPLLLLSGFFIQYNNLFLGLSITSKTKTIAVINLVGSVISVSLNFILISQWGLLGAAISAAMVSFIIFIVQLIYSQKNYYVPLNYKPFVICFCFSCTLILLGNSLSVTFANSVLLVKGIFYIIYLCVCIWISEIKIFKGLIKSNSPAYS